MKKTDGQGSELGGAERRRRLIALMKNSEAPLSGSRLGQETGVSRQVVVQDIALLRTEGYPILATARGYLLSRETEGCTRLIKVWHTNERVEEELQIIVDLGGYVVDVMVNHRVYGQMTAPLNIRSRRDIGQFMEQMRSGKSTPLLNVTSGYHFHTVRAESEAVLDEIEEELRRRQFLAEFLPYEYSES